MAKARIAVVGAGLMGHGIAQVFALAGHEVNDHRHAWCRISTRVKSRIAANLRDLGDDERAVERVQPCVDLAEAVRDADYVVEAVSENLALKQKLFRRDRAPRAPRYDPRQQHLGHSDHRDHAGLERRERALGTHWWNPPFLVPLVEVIETQWTSPQAIAWTMELHQPPAKSRRM